MTRRKSVTFWAWTASVVIHIIVLSVFAIIHFAPRAGAKAADNPLITIFKKNPLLEKSVQSVPKPKIKKQNGIEFENEVLKTSYQADIFSKPKIDNDILEEFSDLPETESIFLNPSENNLTLGTEFFGSRTSSRKICYIVDCSGSMKGMFKYVGDQLKKSISSLEQDHFFYIIFFGNNQILELGDNKLVRASLRNKNQAYGFIERISASGQGDAMQALTRGTQIKDENGFSADVVYFLTDGFEIADGGVDMLMLQVKNLIEQHSPDMRMNTIGFWPQQEEIEILEMVADLTGGDFTLITDNYKYD